jgi:hypothetical protein
MACFAVAYSPECRWENENMALYWSMDQLTLLFDKTLRNVLMVKPSFCSRWRDQYLRLRLFLVQTTDNRSGAPQTTTP